MSKFAKMTLCFFLAGLMIFSAAACGGKAENQPTTAGTTAAATETTTAAPAALAPATFHIYTYNNDDPSKERNSYCIENLKTVMPEITVEVESLDSGDPTYTKMKTYIAAGDVPQFYAVTTVFVDSLLATGQIADLKPFADKVGFTADATPIAIKLGTYKDQLLAFPGISLSFAMLYYNKDIFAQNNIKEPVTYGEFLQVVKDLRAKGIDPIGMMGKEKWPYAMLLDMFATRIDNNASENVIGGKAKFTDEAYMKAAAKVQELARAGAFSRDAMLKDYAAGLADFTSGKSAMLVNGSWSFSELGAAMGFDKLGYLYFPVDDAAQYEESKTHWAGGDGSPVGWSFNPKKFKTPEEQERAAKFLYYWAKFTSEKYALGGNPVVTMKTDKQPAEGFPAVIQQWQKDFSNIKTSPIYIQWNTPVKAGTLFNDGVQKLATGEYDPAQFCADMQKAFDDAR